MSKYLSYIIFFITLSIIKGNTEATISFDLSDPDITIPSSNDIIEMKVPLNTTIKLPSSSLSKSGYFFKGWTEDFIYGFYPKDNFYVTREKILFKPIFQKKDDLTAYTLSYYVEIDGEPVDLSVALPPERYTQNSLIMVSALYFHASKQTQLGYQYDGHPFLQREKLVMPNKNITLTPIWHNVRNITYYTGDVDGINGNNFDRFQSTEGSTRTLPEPERFSRTGYKIVAWHCEYDGEDYPPYFTYSIPDADVDFYAIWEPKEYKILFDNGIKGTEKIRISAKTGTTLIVPEVGVEREGYNFMGWQDNNDEKIYLPGEEYYVKGAMPGLGISLKAIWEKIDE